MRTVSARRILEGLVVGLMLYAANIRGLVIRGIFPMDGVWIEATIEFFLVIIALWLLAKSGLLGKYKSLWLKNWPLILFIGIAAASLLWTIDVRATLGRVLVLVFSSLFAAYLAARLTLQEILNILAGFFAALVVLCFAVVIIWPDTGMMNFYPYYGSWCGIFWHRNYLGSTMALGTSIFLICFSLVWRQPKPRNSERSMTPLRRRWLLIFYGIFYFLSLALVVLSRSATGLILAIVLHVFFVGVLLWLATYLKLSRVHYWILGSLCIVIAVIAYLKLNSVLAIFNRDATFTGRTGMWLYLFQHVISERPLLGHGFGALWLQASFRLAMQSALGWPYPVIIGDNGYIDILLHLGLIGLLSFVAILVLACVRMIKLAKGQRTLLAFAPLLVMVFMLLSNVTLSYILESESFTWIIMAAMLFSATSLENE